MRRLLCRSVILFMLFSSIPANADTKMDAKPLAKIKTPVSSDVLTQSQTKSVQPIDNLVGHFSNPIKVVFSDIDGTIIMPDKNNPMAPPLPSAKTAVIKLREAGIPLILATGRIYPEAKNLAERLGVSNAYLISQQGAEIRDTHGKLIYQDGIKNSDLKEIVAFLEDLKKKNRLNFKIIPAIDGKFYSTESFEIAYIWSKINKVNSFADLGNTVSASSICIFDMNTEELRVVQASLKNRFPSYHIDLSSHCFCDVTSATATKGNAIKKMAEIMGVDLKNCVTFGDAENDISMLKLLKSNDGLAIAVGNAMPSVKENANFVTLPVTDGGFAKGVDKILENNSVLMLKCK